MQVINRAKTDCELTFVKRLGKWSEHELSRRDLLENYIVATAFRAEWDGIDAARVRSYAAMQLHTISAD
jgi:hypothetical protein